MDIPATIDAGADRGERLERTFYAALPYVLLSSGALLTLLQAAWGADPAIAPIMILAVATAAWLGLPRVLPGFAAGGVLTGVHYAGVLAAAAGLVLLDAWFAVFAFSGYVLAFLTLAGGWRYVGVAATSTIMSIAYVGGITEIADGRWALWGAITAVTTLLAAASFRFAEVTRTSGARHRRLSAEMHAANARLEAALEENAALTAQLLAHAREAGIRDERQRVAREIHDTLAQSLAGVLTQLEAADNAEHDEVARRRHQRIARDLARESLADARRTVHAVEPEMLARADLPSAIADTVGRWSAGQAVAVEITVTGEPRPLHPDVETALLRTAQEALTNIAKHARADRVGVTLSYMEDLVNLDVRDDGAGFDPTAVKAPSTSSGFGLTGMRSRVRRLAGRLVIESEPGAGTAISASLPALSAGASR